MKITSLTAFDDVYPVEGLNRIKDIDWDDTDELYGDVYDKDLYAEDNFEDIYITDVPIEPDSNYMVPEELDNAYNMIHELGMDHGQSGEFDQLDSLVGSLKAQGVLDMVLASLDTRTRARLDDAILDNPGEAHSILKNVAEQYK